jgi:RNA polymerase sigma-70 factor, ECF subfamily
MASLTSARRDLLSDARAGSAEALGELLEAHRRYLLAVASSELDSTLQAKADAADLVQESLLEALHDFAHFCDYRPEQLRAWLRQILRNNLANFRRHYRATAMRDVGREVPLPAADMSAQPGEHLPTQIRTPSSHASRREEKEQLFRVIAQLPGHYRDVIVWRIHETQTFAEIGHRLGRSPDAAKQLWLRAVQRLMHELKSRP